VPAGPLAFPRGELRRRQRATSCSREVTVSTCPLLARSMCQIAEAGGGEGHVLSVWKGDLAMERRGPDEVAGWGQVSRVWEGELAQGRFAVRVLGNPPALGRETGPSPLDREGWGQVTRPWKGETRSGAASVEGWGHVGWAHVGWWQVSRAWEGHSPWSRGSVEVAACVGSGCRTKRAAGGIGPGTAGSPGRRRPAPGLSRHAVSASRRMMPASAMSRRPPGRRRLPCSPASPARRSVYRGA
jgi:hypothetical protein